MRAGDSVLPRIVGGPGMAVRTVRLTVADAHSRHDLVVPADATVAELLHVGGVDLSRYVGTTASGTALDLDGEVSVTPGDGGVIWLFDRTAAPQTPRTRATASAAADPATERGRWTLLSLLLAITAAIVLCAVLAPSPLTTGVATIVLMAGAFALLTQPVGDESTYVAFFAPLLAAASGAIALSGFGDAGAMMAGGAVAGATVACVRHAMARARGRRWTGATAVLAALWAVFAVVNAAGFLAEVPAAALTAVQLACAAPIFHYMRGSALEVDADDLIDVPFLMRDALGIRAVAPAAPSPIHPDHTARRFLRARRRSEAGTVAAGALAVLSSLHAVTAGGSGSIEAWCVVGGALGVGCYFLLTSRRLRDGLSRGAALAAGAVIIILSGAALLSALQPDPLAVALGLVIAGGIAGCLVVPLDRDWRSLGWSRSGDIVEAILLALSPAALVYGSGIAGQILEVLP